MFLGDQPLDLGPRQPETFSDQSHWPDRDPRRETDHDVERHVSRISRSAGVETPGVVPVERDAVTPPHDRILKQLGCQAGIVVVQAGQQLTPYRPDIDPFKHGELCGVSADGAEREEPGVEELVIRVDAELAVRAEPLGTTRMAAADDGGQAGGHDDPVLGHRDTPVPVRSSKAKGTQRASAPRDESALQRSHRMCIGRSSAMEMGDGRNVTARESAALSIFQRERTSRAFNGGDRTTTDPDLPPRVAL